MIRTITKGRENVVLKRQKTTCSVCGNHRLTLLFELPDFPLTGIYVKDPVEGEYRNIDQGFQLCQACGHGQLLYTVDPEYLYLDTYSHRSSLSPIATSGGDFFIRFLEEITNGRTFQRVVEVGCNDLYLLRKMESKGERLLGVDPIWQGKEQRVTEKIRVCGKLIEDIDLAEELDGAPDLILSAHTFEHIDDPRKQLERLVEAAADDALFVIEVPGFDSLLTNCRFDQIFHQHIHYFSLASFQKMLDVIGVEYLRHTFNYDYWGGTMLIAFKKSRLKHERFSVRETHLPTEARVRRSYQMFCDQLANLMQIVETPDLHPLYGYGAAQMVPTLAYHMKSDLSFLKCILDDDPRRSDLTYPFLSVWIRRPADNFTLEGASVLVTALDSMRPILKRAFALKARRVLSPLNLF